MIYSFTPPWSDPKTVSGFNVSLTSHPARYHSLYQVLEALEKQSFTPDHIFLFIAAQDISHLDFARLASIPRLSVFATPDLGPGKKLLPYFALGIPSPVIVIDDDLEYDADLFRELFAIHIKNPEAIVASRAHKISRSPGGEVLGYYSWEMEIGDTSLGWQLFPTSGAGVLYPKSCFKSGFFDLTTLRSLSFFTDDLWYYFHARLAGRHQLRLAGQRPLVYIDGTQEVALWRGNALRNEPNLAALIDVYGDPESSCKLSRRAQSRGLVQRVLLGLRVRKVLTHRVDEIR